ncbi:MAG: hypothetical protein WBX25_20040 [Rhodomicrobium sp.]
MAKDAARAADVDADADAADVAADAAGAAAAAAAGVCRGVVATPGAEHPFDCVTDAICQGRIDFQSGLFLSLVCERGER